MPARPKAPDPLASVYGENGATAPIPLPPPELVVSGEDISLAWPLGMVVAFTATHEGSDGIHAEITVSLDGKALHWGRLNLASTPSREQLVRKLNDQAKGIAWRDVLERSCKAAADAIRTGEPILPLEPAVGERQHYLVDKLLPRGETTVLYGDGGVGKGYVALALCHAVAYPCELTLPGGLTCQQGARVLYLDWESTRATQARRLAMVAAGLGIVAAKIDYRAMSRALADDAAYLRAEIARRSIKFVIIDSLAPACGAEPETADANVRAYNALRSFGPSVTKLVIAHVSHATATNRGTPGRPFGSVFVRNLARSAWEIRRSNEETEADLLLALYHRKVNEGRLQAPIAWRLSWADAPSGPYVRISAEEIADVSDLMEGLSTPQRILRLLKRGALALEDITAKIDGVKSDTVARKVRELVAKGRVVQVIGGRFGLADGSSGRADDSSGC